MAEQAVSRPEGLAALSFLVMLAGTAVLAVGEAGSLRAVAVAGAAVCMAGVTGICVFVYRVSRRTGGGVLKSLGRMVVVAVRLIVDLG